MKQVHITVWGDMEYKRRFYVDRDVIDTKKREIAESRELGVFNSAKAANEFGEKHARETKAGFQAWPERTSM